LAVPVDCACGIRYNLKNEYAGRLLECPACHSVFRAPERTAAPLFDRDLFQLREKHLAISTKYYVRDEDGAPLLYVERPSLIIERLVTVAVFMAISLYLFFAFSRVFIINWFWLALIVAYFVGPRRDIFFYPDDRKQAVLLTVTQDYFVQFPATRFTLRDPAGQTIAVYKKNRFTDFLRKRWWVYGPDGALLMFAREDSIILSLLRRLTGLLVDFAAFRTNFVLYAPDGERVLGEFNRKLTIFDRYTLDLSEDADRAIDRRVALALGVLLDTGEGR
jgi:hypothetical protein